MAYCGGEGGGGGGGGGGGVRGREGTKARGAKFNSKFRCRK